MAVKSCTFEVFGKVQGVFFRDSTKQKADEIGVMGFCRNTDSGTVAGEIQAEPAPFFEMKEWLKHTGSPASKIEKCEFGEEQDLPKATYQSFEVLRGTRA